MFPMAVRADRGGGDTSCDRPAVNAGLKLLGDVGVAHAARIRHALMEFGRLRVLQFVRAAMADDACGSGGVARLDGLAVDAGRMLVRLIGMTGGTFWLGYAGGVRIRFVLLMTRRATQVRMSGGLQLLAFFVAGCASLRGVLPDGKGNRAPQGEPQDRNDDWGTHYLSI